MQKLVEHLINSSGKARPVKYALWGMAFYNSGDAEKGINQPKDISTTNAIFKACKAFGRHWQDIKLLKSGIEALNNIDDRADNLPPQAIALAGNTHLGTTPCDFIKNRPIISEEEERLGKKFIDSGFLTEKDAVSFANLAAVLLQQGSQLSLQYLSDKSPETRTQMSEKNMQLGSLSGITPIHLIKQNPIPAHAIESGLTLEHLKDLYPNTAKMTYLAQLYDDMHDIFEDLSKEIKTGHPSPNRILALAHEDGNLLNNMGGVKQTHRIFTERHNNQQNIAFNNFPDSLQQAVDQAGTLYKEISESLPKTASKFLTSAWDATIEGGAKCSADCAQRNSSLPRI